VGQHIETGDPAGSASGVAGRLPQPHWLRWLRWLRARHALVLLAFTSAALAAGGLAWLAGQPDGAAAIWAAATVAATVPAVAWVIGGLRRGQAGVDAIAVLALAGTLIVGAYLAGALIAVMLTGGRSLEAYAQRRAEHDLRALASRVPQSARRRSGSSVAAVPLASVVAGDLLVVGPGEVVPVDGRIEGGPAVLDESVLTGEPLLVDRLAADGVRSGVVNAGNAFDLRATATAADSTYAGIVALADAASAQQAPLVRLADRYAAWFLPATLAVAAGAWAASGSLTRAVAVLVVATPCPLLLAAPVAIVAGMSRAARRGVVVRDGAALENLGNARTLVLDKTGTLTEGRPAVTEVVTAPGEDPARLLRLAASVEAVSPHVLADAIVKEATSRGIALATASAVRETPGQGVTGTVDGHLVRVGKPAAAARWPGWLRAARARAELDGAAIALVQVDGELAGAVLLRDELRVDAPRTLRRLRGAGLTRLVMLTGDRPGPAHEIATLLGLDDAVAECTPQAKVEAVMAERRRAVTAMAGDGINDAPALATADVGIALGGRGATASTEAADIVLTSDRIDRLADAVVTARRSRRIAVQSAVAGMVLSLAAMGVAAIGLLPPAAGALAQELIDIAVIFNALRALRDGSAAQPPIEASTERMLRQFAAEHEQMRDALGGLRQAADRLAGDRSPAALDGVRATYRFLREELLPHEHAEDTRLYPELARPLGSVEATATMSRTHAEIERLTDRIGTHLRLADGDGLRREQLDDLLATMYGLHAVLRLHFAQEEEHYFTLVRDEPPR
jgi:heavy metal translocating P-type ATPase